jgi:hypothetical protein
MAERHPLQLGAGVSGRLLEFGERLFFDGNDGHVVAEAAGALQGKEGEPAVPRDDSNGGHELISLLEWNGGN